jgi:hypothetical protein
MLTYMYYCEVGVHRMQDRLEKITVTTGLTLLPQLELKKSVSY